MPSPRLYKRKKMRGKRKNEKQIPAGGTCPVC
jgi:hypothetical protein